MANLIALNVLNKIYERDGDKLLCDLKEYMDYKSAEDEYDTSFKEDSCVMFHFEIIQYNRIKLGYATEIFSEIELEEYNLNNLDISVAFTLIENDKECYIVVFDDFSCADNMFSDIVNSDHNIANFKGKSIVAINTKILNGLTDNEVSILLDTLVNYNVI